MIDTSLTRALTEAGFRILIIFLYISVLLHVVVTENVHHYKLRSQAAETEGTVIAISEVKMSLPCCQLTLNWTEGLTWLRGSTQHPDGGRAGSPGGTWHGEEVLVFMLVGPGSLSTGWYRTVPHWTCANPLCAQLILERFNQYFSNDSLNFSGLVSQTVGDVALFLTWVDLSLASC